jgi:hypothetical protein
VYEKAKSMTNPPEVILALTKIDLGKLLRYMFKCYL